MAICGGAGVDGVKGEKQREHFWSGMEVGAGDDGGCSASSMSGHVRAVNIGGVSGAIVF